MYVLIIILEILFYLFVLNILLFNLERQQMLLNYLSGQLAARFTVQKLRRLILG